MGHRGMERTRRGKKYIKIEKGPTHHLFVEKKHGSDHHLFVVIDATAKAGLSSPHPPSLPFPWPLFTSFPCELGKPLPSPLLLWLSMKSCCPTIRLSGAYMPFDWSPDYYGNQTSRRNYSWHHDDGWCGYHLHPPILPRIGKTVLLSPDDIVRHQRCRPRFWNNMRAISDTPRSRE